MKKWKLIGIGMGGLLLVHYVLLLVGSKSPNLVPLNDSKEVTATENPRMLDGNISTSPTQSPHSDQEAQSARSKAIHEPVKAPDEGMLRNMWKEGDRAVDSESRGRSRQEFLLASASFLEQYPQNQAIWILRAMAAIELNERAIGMGAARRLNTFGLHKSKNAIVENVYSHLRQLGWDAVVAEHGGNDQPASSTPNDDQADKDLNDTAGFNFVAPQLPVVKNDKELKLHFTAPKKFTTFKVDETKATQETTIGKPPYASLEQASRAYFIARFGEDPCNPNDGNLETPGWEGYLTYFQAGFEGKKRPEVPNLSVSADAIVQLVVAGEKANADAWDDGTKYRKSVAPLK